MDPWARIVLPRCVWQTRMAAFHLRVWEAYFEEAFSFWVPGSQHASE